MLFSLLCPALLCWSLWLHCFDNHCLLSLCRTPVPSWSFSFKLWCLKSKWKNTTLICRLLLQNHIFIYFVTKCKKGSSDMNLAEKNYLLTQRANGPESLTRTKDFTVLNQNNPTVKQVCVMRYPVYQPDRFIHSFWRSHLKHRIKGPENNYSFEKIWSSLYLLKSLKNWQSTVCHASTPTDVREVTTAICQKW